MKRNSAVQNPIKATLLLLAGGRGVRMGGSKLYLEIDGTLLIERILCETAPIFMETILLVSRGGKAEAVEKLGLILNKYNVRIVEDSKEATGPLEGLCAGLENMTQSWGFLVGCDMPSVQENLARFMSTFCTKGTDVIAGELNGYIEPLHAFYSKNCTAAVQKSLKNKQHKMKFFYRDVNLIAIKKELLQTQGDVKKSFFNLNYPKDLIQMKKMVL